MLEVSCPGVSLTEDIRGYFQRFHTRLSGKHFRTMLDEQFDMAEESVRASRNADLLADAAAALG
eukprot:2521762-Alexandrium_andersonii.AAC.1